MFAEFERCESEKLKSIDKAYQRLGGRPSGIIELAIQFDFSD